MSFWDSQFSGAIIALGSVYVGLSPFPVTVTTRIIPFLVGNPELNLHLSLESWEGGQPNVYVGIPQNPKLGENGSAIQLRLEKLLIPISNLEPPSVIGGIAPNSFTSGGPLLDLLYIVINGVMGPL